MGISREARGHRASRSLRHSDLAAPGTRASRAPRGVPVARLHERHEPVRPGRRANRDRHHKTDFRRASQGAERLRAGGSRGCSRPDASSQPRCAAGPGELEHGRRGARSPCRCPDNAMSRAPPGARQASRQRVHQSRSKPKVLRASSRRGRTLAVASPLPSSP
jgi:hypothetical protein